MFQRFALIATISHAVIHQPYKFRRRAAVEVILQRLLLCVVVGKPSDSRHFKAKSMKHGFYQRNRASMVEHVALNPNRTLLRSLSA